MFDPKTIDSKTKVKVTTKKNWRNSLQYERYCDKRYYYMTKTEAKSKRDDLRDKSAMEESDSI